MTQLPALFLSDWIGKTDAAIDLARTAEQRGFPAIYSESPGDNIALSLAVLDRTERIRVGTTIAGIYLRHAHTTATAAMLIEELHPERFVLGLGVSHVPFHQDMGVQFGKPLGDMREYVGAIRDVAGEHPLPPILVGAMRRRMTALAGEIGDGVMWANAARSHIPFSRSHLPDDLPAGFILSNSVPACVADDRSDALAAIKRYLLFYMKLPNYQKYWEEAGYQDEVAAARRAIEDGDDDAVMAAMPETMVRDIAAYGTASEVRDQLDAWYETGLNEVVFDPVSATRPAHLAGYETIEALTR